MLLLGHEVGATHSCCFVLCDQVDYLADEFCALCDTIDLPTDLIAQYDYLHATHSELRD